MCGLHLLPWSERENSGSGGEGKTYNVLINVGGVAGVAGVKAQDPAWLLRRPVQAYHWSRFGAQRWHHVAMAVVVAAVGGHRGGGGGVYFWVVS
jgi:hypothetical protein